MPPFALVNALQHIIRFLIIVSMTLLLLVILWPWLEQIRYGWEAEPRAIAPRGDLAADEQSTIGV